jgi:hypothetical protein
MMKGFGLTRMFSTIPRIKKKWSFALVQLLQILIERMEKKGSIEG